MTGLYNARTIHFWLDTLTKAEINMYLKPAAGGG